MVFFSMIKKLIKNDKCIEWCVYAVVFVLQLLVFLYWSRVKANFFVDEFFSMGYASDYFNEGTTYQYIYLTPDFKYDVWLDNALFKEKLALSYDKTVINASLVFAFTKLATGRTYFGLMNIAESILKCGFAKTAMMLNLVFIIIAEVGLIALMNKLGFDRITSALATVMFGFSCYVISVVEYVRFYALVLMLMILVLDFAYTLWHASKWKSIIMAEIGLFVSAYFAYRNSELTLAFFGSFMFFLSIAMLLYRKIKQFFINVLFGIVGILYIAFTTDYLGMLLYPDKYSGGINVAISASQNIRNASWNTLGLFLKWIIDLFETYYFGNRYILFMMLAILIALTVINIILKSGERIRRKRNIKNNTDINMNGGENENKRQFSHFLEADLDSVFIIVLIATTIVYSVFCAVSGYRRVWRYYCFGFVSIAFTFWYLIDRLIKVLSISCKKKVLVLISILVIINVFIPFRTRNVEYMFESDREFVLNVNESHVLKAVLFLDGLNKSKTLAGHELYDCVNAMSIDSKLYFVDSDVYNYEKVDFPNEFLLWFDLDSETEHVRKDLEQHGFEIKELGSDRCSQAFLCILNRHNDGKE